MTPQEDTHKFIQEFDDFCSQMPLCAKFRPQLAALQLRLQQPCVLAIAGKVKAGKSTFLNALLGKNLAKVGTEETTATINIFRHISEADKEYTPERPVRVQWDSGVRTYESLDYMNSLQGNDEETIRKAQGITYLEFFEDNDYLRNVTLVDTPGTDAVVGETGDAHQQVVDKYFALREKHRNQTIDYTAQADAVIYLVGAVAQQGSQTFLNDFRASSEHSSSLNALGVLSKVDIDKQLLDNRVSQTEYIARNLTEQLYTVVPVSAGIHLETVRCRGLFPKWQAQLKDIPQNAFYYLIDAEGIFLENAEVNHKPIPPQMYAQELKKRYGNSDKPTITLDCRRNMRSDSGNMPWAVFRTILTQLYENDTADQAEQKLLEIANIDNVNQAIKKQFFDRSINIRCFRVLDELNHIIRTIQYEVFYTLKQNSANKTIWKQTVADGSAGKPKDAIDNLIAFIDDMAPTPDYVEQKYQQFLNEIINPIDALKAKLEAYDRNYRMLLMLQGTRASWSQEEYDELCALFGLCGTPAIPAGLDPDQRQTYWNLKSMKLRNRDTKEIAEQAVESYSTIGARE